MTLFNVEYAAINAMSIYNILHYNIGCFIDYFS